MNAPPKEPPGCVAMPSPPQRLDVLRAHVLASMDPPLKRLFIANRGEIACRIHRAARALGVETVGAFTEEDGESLHRRVLDRALPLPKGATPVAPYLDAEALADLASREGCGAVHPGYGFLAESAHFASLCEARGMAFVGPAPATIDLFGDKTKAKACAAKAGLPVLRSSGGVTSAEEARSFVDGARMPFPVLLKASFGGGGRGQAVVARPEDLSEAFARCSKEAEMSFGRPEVFVEHYLLAAKHIEVQVLGDGGRCVHLFERDCSVQLRKQKVVEIAPSRRMAPQLRERICGAAVRLCESVGYRNAGTVEFLVDGDLADPGASFYFLELNPRIQVEHTITEEITGIDLVQAQLRIAGGRRLTELGIAQERLQTSGFAIQVRVGLQPGGGGQVKEYVEPSGVRVDSSVSLGSRAVTDYDPMIAKLIVRGSGFAEALAAARAAVDGFVVTGLSINTEFLRRVLTHGDLASDVHTTWVEDRGLHLAAPATSAPGREGVFGLEAPFPGQVVEVRVKAGDEVAAGAVLVVLSAMKMLNDVTTDRPAKVLEVLVEPQTQVAGGKVLLKLRATGDAPPQEAEAPLPQGIRRPIGGAVCDAWHAGAEDQAYATPVLRSKAKASDPTYAKRLQHNTALCDELQRRLFVVRHGGSEKARELHRRRGKNLVRDRIRKIIDPNSDIMELSALAAWEMYGGGVHSGGTVCAIGLVCGRECMFIGTDATIKGGVVFPVGYRKWLRGQEIAQQNRLPCIYLIDGGGAKLDAQGGASRSKGPAGRDTSFEGDLPAMFVEGGRQFYNQARMSALGIPQIALVCGMCTAGGAYTPAMCDETIIVQGTGTVYLGGPPLVKAATGEDADEQELGGALMHTTKSGTCDHLAPDEEAAFAMCREIVEHLAGRVPRSVLSGCVAPEPPLYDEESILGIIPESTSIPFDIREVIARIADGSRFHEFKAKYGPTMICGWAHIEGYPVGILGNNGMLFSESAIKATHFVQICGKRGTPLVFLHNITGFIVGTTYEQGGITKDGAKMINAVSNVPVAKFSVVCGGSFGAGNYAMCGPAFGPRFTFLWPGAKISVMGGEQAASVVAIVKQNALKRDGQQQMPPEMEAMLKKPIVQSIEGKNSAWHSSAGLFDDGIIDPRSTRRVLAQAISISLNAPITASDYGVFRM